jgi:hypothetical protein
MQINPKSLGISLKIAIFIVISSFFCLGQSAASAPQDLIGTWDVLAELITSSSENPNDPYSPKPGSIKPDVWNIQNGDLGPVLTGSSGSILGQYTENGAVFEGTYPLGSGVYTTVRIECYMDSTKSMIGTNENDYWGTNTVTGEMIRLGIESWKFRATKK